MHPGNLGDFLECERCASKPGWPELCKSCFQNRTAISTLQTRLKEGKVWKAIKTFFRDFYESTMGFNLFVLFCLALTPLVFPLVTYAWACSITLVWRLVVGPAVVAGDWAFWIGELVAASAIFLGFVSIQDWWEK